MNAKIFTPLLIALLFVSCTRRSETATKAVQENNEKIEECTIVLEDEFDDDFEVFVSENIETEPIIIPIINGEEDFRVFLEKFGTDSLFQVSRIVFPLEILEFDWDEDGCFSDRDEYGNWIRDRVKVSTRNLEQHRFMRVFVSSSSQIEVYEDECFMPKIEAFMLEHSPENGALIPIRHITRIFDNEYSVNFFWIDVSGGIGYHFRKDENGKWHLVKIDARST